MITKKEGSFTVKTIFLINGFRHQSTEKSFDYIDELFSAKCYKVLKPKISWNYKVMSDYVSQFESFYNKHKSEYNHVFGFSFGAMIAFITAPTLKPDELSICSLSPYFIEDEEKNRWINGVGSRRMKDFDQYSSKSIASKIKADTTVFYGAREANKYADLKERGEQAAKDIVGAKLLIAKDAKHDISDPGYIEAINKRYE